MCLPISLPLNGIVLSFWGSKSEEQRDRISSFINYVLESGCSSVTIIVACELQRFAVMNAKNCNEEEALEKINAEKLTFMEMLNEIIQSYKKPDIKFFVQDWSAQKRLEGYQEKFDLISREYNSNDDYKNSIKTVANEFQKHYNRSKTTVDFQQCITNNIKRIIEELSVLALWSFDVILHPVSENIAMQMTKNLLSLSYLYNTFKLRAVKSSEQNNGLMTSEYQQIMRNQIRLEQKLKQQSLEEQKRLEEKIDAILRFKEQKRLEEQKLCYEQKCIELNTFLTLAKSLFNQMSVLGCHSESLSLIMSN